jgi:predicted lipoprotein with Yx(FWY)xxD motif
MSASISLASKVRVIKPDFSHAPAKPLKVYKYHKIGVILLSKGSKFGLLILVIALMAMTAMVENASNYTIKTATNKTMGTYLVNMTGFTLYYFTNDAPGNGTSACSGGCVTLWPPFYSKNVTVPAGLNATDFTAVMRKDKMNQAAFKGWPLYYYSKDMKPGDANGNGFAGKWFVIDPMKFPPK